MKIFRNFTCKRITSRIESVTFKSRSKSRNFRHFWPFLPISQPKSKFFLFFAYTVDPRELNLPQDKLFAGLFIGESLVSDRQALRSLVPFRQFKVRSQLNNSVRVTQFGSEQDIEFIGTPFAGFCAWKFSLMGCGGFHPRVSVKMNLKLQVDRNSACF